MACGVHLGIFWILCRIFLCRIFMLFLVPAEHLSCWAAQAQNSNMYAGFSQQDGGLRRGSSGRYPQNQFRQASVPPVESSSLSAGTGYGRGISSSGRAQIVSPPVGSYASVRSLQSSSLLNPSWSVTKSTQPAAKESQKNEFGLSANIASGSALSQRFGRKKQNGLASRSRAQPVQQPRSRPSGYQSRQPETQVYDRSPALLNQKPAQTGLTPMTSKMFSPHPPGPIVRSRYRMQTSASAPAKRVTAESKKAARLAASQNERTRFNPGQAEVGKPFRSRLFPTSEPSYQATSDRASGYRQNAAAVLQPRGLGAAAPDFHPSQTHRIPQKFGGAAIRRLKGPVQKERSKEPQKWRSSVRPQLRT